AAELAMLFIADMLGAYEREHEEVFARSTHGERLEPITTLAAIAMVTKHLGLTATVATSYTQPYDVARSIATLDLISEGRAGWNVVTGGLPSDADQYSIEY